MGMIQTIINDAKTMEAEVIRAERGKQRMRNHKVAACLFRQLPHLEVAVFGALPVRIQKKSIAFIVVHGFMVCS